MPHAWTKILLYICIYIYTLFYSSIHPTCFFCNFECTINFRQLFSYHKRTVQNFNPMAYLCMELWSFKVQWSSTGYLQLKNVYVCNSLELEIVHGMTKKLNNINYSSLPSLSDLLRLRQLFWRAPIIGCSTQQYLGVVIDNDLHWSSQISTFCKMSHYLYLISCHERNFLRQYWKFLYSLLYFLIFIMLCLSGGPLWVMIYCQG